MINGHKTDREISMEQEIKMRGIEWEAVVLNEDVEVEDKVVKTANVTTPYSSVSGDTFDNILHKIKLDLMSSLRLDLKSPIKIQIRRVSRFIADEQHKEK